LCSRSVISVNIKIKKKSIMSISKVCAVFGFGPGVGAAVARKWSSEGFQVALLSRKLEKVQEAECSIPNSKGFACDVTIPESIEAAVADIETSLGPIHTIVYNAGNGVWKTWDTIELDQFDLAMKTNVNGLLKVTQVVAPGMIARGEGAIMVTGATASMRGKPFTAGFAPQKGAQRLLAQSLARSLGPKSVHVGLFIIDGSIGKDDSDPSKIDPNAIAQTYWNVANQPKSCWSFETEVRPSVENW
jgi:NADP-dependent 3-hydroxy acid dehydrogenase YdfG